MNNEKSGWTYGDLPHWTDPLVFVTFRLADSLPVNSLSEMRCFDKEWLDKYRSEWTDEIDEQYKRYRKKFENDLLDKALGSCILKRYDVRQIVVDTLMHFNNERYLLHAFVIMPNHVHLLIQMYESVRLQDAMHSIKSFSARKINELLQTKGAVWEREYYDRFIRDSHHYHTVVNYIENNPKHCYRGEYTLYLS